jgi:TM2 domain-containing membrane protein YozV
MTHAETALKDIVSTAHISPKRRSVALALCVVLGIFGLHRFYVGKIGTGFVWLMTMGALFFGWMFDFFYIATGNFKDIDGKRLVNW